MYGLLGNGAGKSTLMRILATLQQPSSGGVTFDGIDVLAEPMRLRAQLGYLPQDFGVYPRVSAEDLLDHLAARCCTRPTCSKPASAQWRASPAACASASASPRRCSAIRG